MRDSAGARTTLFSWLFMGALVAVCITLGILQYRWISAVSETARERMSEGLQANLMRLSRDFNTEISVATSSLAQYSRVYDPQTVESQLEARFAQWKIISRHPRLFERIGLAVPGDGGVELRMLDFDRGLLMPATWPVEWSAVRSHIESNVDDPHSGRRPGPPPVNEGLAFEVPIFGAPVPGARPVFGGLAAERGPGRGFGPREPEIAWVIFSLNLPYLRETVLPECVRRDLGSNGALDYQVEVVARNNPDSVIFQSDPRQASEIDGSADASVSLFEPAFNFGARRNEFGDPPDDGSRGPRGRGRGPSPDMGRWQMYVRHRAGSLEAVVEKARFRNMSVTAGVLLLIFATGVALLRYTIRAQRLANMQMEFVAGVSHELRTPLTVIHTAGYNLQGKLARNPAQVEQYGAMIHCESARLRDLVEQVLQFASASAGRAIQEREPLSVARVIEEAMEASRSALGDPAYILESKVDDGLPPVLGDPQALRHALENLVGNAVKYGAKDSHWIGVFASKADGGSAAVEIRVADRGPGIPEHEQRRIFDPFFRGARAIQDQVHGTGLGLSLVKRIVEAHGGTVRVKSAPMRGTEFILRIPTAPEAA
jgi:signal transduction histidine kinase